jgi:hypothetical protein
VYTEQVVGSGGYTGEQEVFGFGPPRFQAWIAQREKSGQKLW